MVTVTNDLPAKISFVGMSGLVAINLSPRREGGRGGGREGRRDRGREGRLVNWLPSNTSIQHIRILLSLLAQDLITYGTQLHPCLVMVTSHCPTTYTPAQCTMDSYPKTASKTSTCILARAALSAKFHEQLEMQSGHVPLKHFWPVNNSWISASMPCIPIWQSAHSLKFLETHQIPRDLLHNTNISLLHNTLVKYLEIYYTIHFTVIF